MILRAAKPFGYFIRTQEIPRREYRHQSYQIHPPEALIAAAVLAAEAPAAEPPVVAADSHLAVALAGAAGGLDFDYFDRNRPD